MVTAVLVAATGAAGALARYGIDGAISGRYAGFPLGTLVVNVSGSFLLGFVFTVTTERFDISPSARSAVTIGLLGAYTTFSTLSLETYRLLEDGAWGLAAANALGSLAAGLTAVYLGVVVGRLV